MKRLFEVSSYNFSNILDQYPSEMIILGSSTTARGLNPTLFHSTLNINAYSFAKDGTGIFYALSVLRNLPSDAPIEYVILGIDPASFASGFASKNFKQIQRLLPYAGQDNLLRYYLEETIHFLDLKLQSKTYPYIAVTKSIIKDYLRGDSTENRGFQPLKGVMDVKPTQHKGSQQTIAAPYPIAPEALDALKAIRTEIESRDLKLILITVPLYNKLLRSTTSENAEIMSQIRLQLGGRNLCDLSGFLSGEILDLTSDSDFFFDGAHLNDAGSSLFSALVAEEIRQVCFW